MPLGHSEPCSCTQLAEGTGCGLQPRALGCLSPPSGFLNHSPPAMSHLLSHFIPWWMSPYSNEPQWSQKVGLEYVWILNLCLLRGSWEENKGQRL